MRTRLAEGWPLLAIFAVALGARLLYLTEWSGSTLGTVLVGDGRGYHEWALRIAAGEWSGSEVFYQAPLYPYLMGALYWVTGPEVGLLRGLQVLLGSLSCALLASVGVRLFSPGVGWTAGLLLALYAPALYYDGLVQKTSLGSFLLVASLWALCSRRALLAGVALGAYALTRENALLLIPLCAAWLALQAGDEGRWRRAGLLLLGAALLLVPVAARNSALGGAFLPTTSQLGPNLYIGNHHGATGRYLPLRYGRGSSRYERDDATALAEAALGRRLGAGEVSDYWVRRTLDDVAREPLAWLGVVAVKARLLVNAHELMDTESFAVYADESRVLAALGGVLHFGTLLPFALVGLFATRRRTEVRLLWLVLAAMAAGPLLFYVTGRYRYPLVPPLCLFAAAGLGAAWAGLRARDWSALAAPAALLVGCAIASNWSLGLEPDPRSGARYNLGLALREAGRLDEALEQLGRARSLWPDSADVELQLGHVRHDRGESDVALVHFERAAELAPGRVEPWLGLGMVRMSRGDADAASEAYREALRLDPDSVEAHNNRASLLAGRGRWDEAAPHFRAAAAASPERVEILVNLGTAEFQIGAYEAALAAYGRALENDPGLASARYGAARTLEALGRTGAAARMFELLLRAEDAARLPFAADAMARLADARATCRDPRLRDAAEALRLAETARRAGPELESLQALAAARAANGDFEGALRSSDQALELAARTGPDPARVETLRERRARFAAGQPVERDCPL